MDEQPSPLQEIRDRLALAIGENAVFDGWTRASVDAAADQAGVDRLTTDRERDVPHADVLGNRWRVDVHRDVR